MYKFAFVGNPNAGKTTWINYLADVHMKVANYLGVSVQEEITEISFENEKIMLIDLPGIYDLDVTNGEENFTKDYLKNHPVDLIVNVIDIRDIKRSLHLTAQLKKLHIPMLVLLNFVNENMNVEEIRKLSTLIRTPILFSTMKQKEDILSTMLEVKHSYVDTTFEEREIKKIDMQTIKKEYHYDQVLLHPVLGIVMLVIILLLSIWGIYTLAQPFSHLITVIFDGINQDLIMNIHTVKMIERLIQAIWFSFTSIVSFLPFLAGIFLLLAVLEESGYIARIAYLLDGAMQYFHLSGKSVIPMLVGFGCNVPAVMATRTISSPKERIACVMMIPFVSCSAKLPVFLLFANSFFSKTAIWVIILLYGLSLLVSLFVGSYIASKTKEEEFFLLELPSYAIPKWSIVYKKVKKEVLHFLKKVSKVMVVSMLVLTFLFPVLQSDAYQKIFAPLPFATSEAAVESLPFGLVSKENLVVYYASKLEDVSMNEYIQGLWKDDQAKLRAFCYMMYLAMSIPCVMTLGAIRSEFGRKILMLSLGFMLVVPYVLSFVAFYLIVLMQNIVF